MKRYGFGFLISCSCALYSFQDTNVTQKLFNAINASDKEAVEQLIAKHDIVKSLTYGQQTALWDAACAAVRHRKANIRLFFGIPVDISKIKQGTLLGLLGLISLRSYSSMCQKKSELNNKGCEGGKQPVFKIYGIFQKPVTIPSWSADLLLWSGLGSASYGLWKFIQAFHLFELSCSRSIKESLRKIFLPDKVERA
jgi:hypothetical protein